MTDFVMSEEEAADLWNSATGDYFEAQLVDYAAKAINHYNDTIPANIEQAARTAPAARNAGLTDEQREAIEYAAGLIREKWGGHEMKLETNLRALLAAPEASNWQERVQLRMLAKPEHDEPGVIGGACAAPEAAPEAASDADLVLVPRGLIGAALGAITGKRDAPKTIEKLRAIAYAPREALPEAAPVPQPSTVEVETAVETLRHVIECLRKNGNFTDEEGEATDFLEPLLEIKYAAPLSEANEAENAFKQIVHELRTYDPMGDEYKGKHIHKIWAREIEAVISKLRPSLSEPSLPLSFVKNVALSYSTPRTIPVVAPVAIYQMRHFGSPAWKDTNFEEYQRACDDENMRARIVYTAAPASEPIARDVLTLMQDLTELASEVNDHTPDSFNKGVMRLSNRARVILEAARDAAILQAATPNGWKLVPIDPPSTMLDELAQVDDISYAALLARYRKMLAAVPILQAATRDAPHPSIARAIAQEERACRAEDALIDLVNQIRKCNPVDDHGHSLKMNRAYIEAQKLLDASAPKGDGND